MNHIKMTAAFRVLPLLLAVFLLAGCSGKKEETEQTGSAAGAGDTENVQTDAMTEAVTEPVTETITEEMDYRPIQEVLSEETLTWAGSFQADDTEKLVYTIPGLSGEENLEYEVTDPGKIGSFFEALMELTVAGLADTFIQEAGDTYDFYMKDGTVIHFEFYMGCYAGEDGIYETDNSDRLWELTGRLIPQEDLDEL